MSSTESLQEYKNIVGSRIRQARQMAGFDTIASLADQFPEWGVSRLGNYENGTSLPNPLDIKRIAKETGTSPCWITFGIGTIRSAARDIQAVRHQNLTHSYEKLSKAGQAGFRSAVEFKPVEIKQYLTNPFLKLTDTLCRKIERHLGKPKGWMDEQQIDNDGLSNFFPDDIRELMMIYSGLDGKGRDLFLELARTFSTNYE